MQILSEHETGLAIILWSVYRDVNLWAMEAADTRTRLFNENAFQRRVDEINDSGAHPRLLIALTLLTQVAANDPSIDAAHVTSACRLVAGWAEERRAMATAVAYAQAGALASPEDGAAGVYAGRILLSWGRFARAETWLRRGVGVARRARPRDTLAYTQGLVLLGDLYRVSRRWDQARHYYTMGYRAARRHGIQPSRGEANHGMMLCYMEAGSDLAAAERHARAAQRAYGKTHPRLGELVHDLARLWIMQGQYGRAIPPLQRLLHARTDAPDRAWTLALIARAAAGTGETPLYQEAWSNAYSLLNRIRSFDPIAEAALVTLARAAVAKPDLPRVEQANSLYQSQGGRASDALREELAALASQARKVVAD